MNTETRTGGAKILIVAPSNDLHAAAAATSLRRRHGAEVVRIDTATVTEQRCRFRLGAVDEHVFGPQALEEITAVWWRRPELVAIPAGINAEHDEYRRIESQAFVRGLMWSVDCRWINDPGKDRIATNKIVQLKTAAACGLSVPETLVTNDPDEARAFIASRDRPVICKRNGESRALSTTRLIDDDNVRRLGTITLSPTIFQDFVEPGADIRIVWMGDAGIAIHIDSANGGGRIDSRIDNSVNFSSFTLPDDVTAALARFMTRLGLAFGVIDMRRGVDGRFWFLEVNPQGQFAYLEILSKVPIFDPMADFLVSGASDIAGILAS